MAYLAPTIWGMFIPAFGRVGAIRMTFTLMAAIAFICMLVPVFCIREKDYVDTVPAKESAFGSLAATFKNGEFRKFVASDIFYWIALTMFQTGLPFFVTSLLKLPETMTTLYFVGMTALSLVFYIPVNKLTPKLGKKKMILFAFAVFSLAYFYTGFMGKMSFIPASVQGLILTVVLIIKYQYNSAYTTEYCCPKSSNSITSSLCCPYRRDCCKYQHRNTLPKFKRKCSRRIKHSFTIAS